MIATDIKGQPVDTWRQFASCRQRVKPAILLGDAANEVILRRHGEMDANEIQVNCGQCGKSMVVRLADIDGKRLVDCVDCERAVQPRPVLRLVRDTNPSP